MNSNVSTHDITPKHSQKIHQLPASLTHNKKSSITISAYFFSNFTLFLSIRIVLCVLWNERIIWGRRAFRVARQTWKYLSERIKILDYSICRSIMNSRCLFWLKYYDFMDICVYICLVSNGKRTKIIVPFYERLLGKQILFLHNEKFS